jgi:hypothetical protein
MRFLKRRAQPPLEPVRRYFSPERELFTGQEFAAHVRAAEVKDRFYPDRWF